MKVRTSILIGLQLVIATAILALGLSSQGWLSYALLLVVGLQVAGSVLLFVRPKSGWRLSVTLALVLALGTLTMLLVPTAHIATGSDFHRDSPASTYLALVLGALGFIPVATLVLLLFTWRRNQAL
jgi:hypothetical protein